MMVISEVGLIRAFQEMLHNYWVHIFVIVVIFDIITGIAKGFIVKESSSTKGLMGLIKHLLVILLVFTAIPYLNIVGMNQISNWFLFFFIVVYAISITENWGQLGLPLPKWIKETLLKLKGSLDDGPGNNDNTKDD